MSAPYVIRYDADVAEAGQGKFRVTGRGIPVEIVDSDPEHSYCATLVRQGYTDGGVLFWRGTTPSIQFPSILKASRTRIDLGSQFPTLRRRTTPEESAAIRRRMAA